ncbi:MAG: hypothetical protein LC658_01735, partial [Bacteroidales bacterium]|nr:hypothetical protein [Bacteroidales bacterium]
NELKKDKSSLLGNPVVRSEFLYQAFFGEFFRIREISKIFIKYLVKEKVLNNNNKKSFVDFYFMAFDWVYEIRNNFIHQGANLKDDSIELDFSVFDDFPEDEKERFISLLKESNTRENTVEIQCTVYVKLVHSIMDKYIEFQNFFNNTLADLIVSYEILCLNISITKNKD